MNDFFRNQPSVWRYAAVTLALLTGFAQAATITVNSLLDDVFPDATGAIFDVVGAPVTLAASKCTLRMPSPRPIWMWQWVARMGAWPEIRNPPRRSPMGTQT